MQLTTYSRLRTCAAAYCLLLGTVPANRSPIINVHERTMCKLFIMRYLQSQKSNRCSAVVAALKVRQRISGVMLHFETLGQVLYVYDVSAEILHFNISCTKPVVPETQLRNEQSIHAGNDQTTSISNSLRQPSVRMVSMKLLTI